MGTLSKSLLLVVTILFVGAITAVVFLSERVSRLFDVDESWRDPLKGW